MRQDFPNSNVPLARSARTPEDLLAPLESLRLLAKVEPPSGLADRVHHRIAKAQTSVRRGVWASFMPMRQLQYAGAAVLAIAVAGSTWAIYHRTPQAASVKMTVQGTSNGVQEAGSGQFKSADTKRRPSTLKPILVPSTKPSGTLKKKPSASRFKPGSASAQTHSATPINP